MLLQTQTLLKEQNIVVFKLSSGEEIIGKIAGFDNTFVYLDSPQRFVITPTQSGLADASFIGNSEKAFSLYLSQIVFMAQPKDEIKTLYESSVTGIALPDKNIIIK